MVFKGWFDCDLNDLKISWFYNEIRLRNAVFKEVLSASIERLVRINSI
jgi:hypothetical protein